MIKGTIDNAFNDAISFEAEQDLFYTNISNALHVLVEGIKAEIAPELLTLQSTNWTTFDEVGDQSPYLSNIVGIIRKLFPTISDLLSEVYFRAFSDKFVFSFLPLYVQSISSCNRIGEFGAQQLLLDTRELKTVLLDVNNSTFDTFKKFVTVELERCEVMLKLVSMSKGTEVALLLENFQILWKDGALSDLEIVLELRGVNKNEQEGILRKAEAAGVPRTASRPSMKTERLDMESSSPNTSGFVKPNKFDFFSSMKEFSADMTSVIGSTSNSLQTSYKRAVQKK